MSFQRALAVLVVALVAVVPSAARAATVWQEGEAPASSTMNRHPWWYDKVKTEELSGGGWISNFSDKKEGTAAYNVDLPEAGEYAFWVRGNPVKSKLAYKVDGGEWKDLSLEGARENKNIAADGKPDLRFIAWIDGGKLTLGKGKHEIAFRMYGGPQNHGALDCFVLTTENFAPSGLLRPGEKAAATNAPVADADTWPFTPPADQFTADAVLDLRGLSEREAGETGFVKLSADGDGFVRGNGEPIRFWAIVSDARRKTPAEMETHCRFLAKMGVNMVRIHADVSNTKAGAKVTDVNEKEIDAIQRFVAAARKNGIYVTISPFWAHAKVPASWGIDGYAGESAWGVLFFNPEMQRGYKAWVKELYTRPNPYTGRPLKDEPAVAVIQVKNEDSLLFWTFQGIKDAQKRVLAGQFAAWLKGKYGSVEKAYEAWKGERLKQDDPGNGVVWFYQTWDLLQKSAGGRAARQADQFEFMAWRQREFYADMEKHYRDLGCRQLVNAMNWRSADAVRMDDAERWSYLANEVVAVNRYTGVIHTGQNNGYRIDPGHQFVSQSVLKNPLALPCALKQPAGHPFLITETAWCHPGEYQTEAPMLHAAYQSLTGVDVTYWFATGEVDWLRDPRRMFWPVGSSYAIDKWSCATPTGIAQFPAHAVAFRLGYIQQADQPAVYEERSLASIWQRKVPIISEAEKFDPNRDKGDFAPQSPIKTEVDPLALLVGPVVAKFGGDEANSKVVDLSKYINRGAGTVKSMTGQIALNFKTGLCTVDAPKYQGVAGFLKEAGGAFELSDVSIRSDNTYATIAVTALDDRPLRTSKKVLVQVGTTARLGGWTTRPVQMKQGKGTVAGEEIIHTGTPPWRVANTRAAVTVRNAGVTKARVLSVGGYPIGEVVVKVAGGVATVELPANAMYVVVE